jgi:hypothetical protein
LHLLLDFIDTRENLSNGKLLVKIEGIALRKEGKINKADVQTKMK